MASPKAPKTDAALVALVDEIGTLYAELSPHKLKLARLELLRKSLRARYATAQADQFFTVDGQRFSIVVGPKENTKTIDYPALLKLIGATSFSEFATCTLAAIESFAPAAYPEVVSIAATGSRSLKVTEKGKAA